MRTKNNSHPGTGADHASEMPFLTSLIDPNVGELLNLIPIPLYFKDRQGRYQRCNTAFENFASMPGEKFLGKDVFDIWPEQEAGRFFSDEQELFEHPRLHVYETTLTPGTGEKKVVRIYKTPLRNDQGVVEGLLGAIVDLSDKAAEEKRLKRLADRDNLTGLANRREGYRQLQRIFNHSSRRGTIFPWR